jgi:N-acyl-D-aspartate/D-glutamate deacylase
MIDVRLRGGLVVDGSGRAGFVGDVGIDRGRIVAIGAVGAVEEQGRTEVDATGLVITPGFVDPHTHYDAQLFWDPGADPSVVHGVTSVIAGNCGFTLAPIAHHDDYVPAMMARVEAIPLASLLHGLPWNWETFGQYLDSIEGRVAVNAGFLVGHCAIRRLVMGDEAVGGVATAEQLDRMVDVLRQSLDAGGLGFSTTRAASHVDNTGSPVPSRWADRRELLMLCHQVGRCEGTSLAGSFGSGFQGFDDDEIGLLAEMSGTAKRPLNWNLLTVAGDAAERIERQLSPWSLAQAAGGAVVALMMPIALSSAVRFASDGALALLPGWHQVLSLSHDEQMVRLADPDVRHRLEALAQSPEVGLLRRFTRFATFTVGETFSPANGQLRGLTIGEIARRRATSPFDTLLDIALADQLRTIFWPAPDDDETTRLLRDQLLTDHRVVLGGSDAGAHLDRNYAGTYPARFLAEVLSGNRSIGLERAVQRLTDEPARLFGLKERGRLAAGNHADVVVFDPEAIGSTEPVRLDDLPGNGGPRMTAHPLGLAEVFVNGVEVARDGRYTGATPGTVLRSGRATA